MFILFTFLFSLLLQRNHFSALRGPTKNVKLEFLESNSWYLKFGELSVMIDPVMDTLDFGIPVLYSGVKKYINGKEKLLELVPSVDFVLISQGLDDHAHSKTLAKLVKLKPDLAYIAPFSAQPILKASGIDLDFCTFLSPGMKKNLVKGSSTLQVTATKGALVGPPWQNCENGYILKQLRADLSEASCKSIYYEPHCMFDETELAQYNADVVITPIVSQELPGYTLVAGGEKALQLAKTLKAKCVVPMNNGDLNQSGLLASLVRSKGTLTEFKRLIAKSEYDISVENVVPGVPFFI